MGNGIGWDIARDDRSCTDDGAIADADAIQNDRAGGQPDIVADANATLCAPLQAHGYINPLVAMILGYADYMRGNHAVCADLEIAVAIQYAERPDSGAIANLYPAATRLDQRKGPDADLCAKADTSSARIQLDLPADMAAGTEFDIFPAAQDGRGRDARPDSPGVPPQSGMAKEHHAEKWLLGSLSAADFTPTSLHSADGFEQGGMPDRKYRVEAVGRLCALPGRSAHALTHFSTGT